MSRPDSAKSTFSLSVVGVEAEVVTEAAAEVARYSRPLATRSVVTSPCELVQVVVGPPMEAMARQAADLYLGALQPRVAVGEKIPGRLAVLELGAAELR
jgi:hypothetical protein